MYWLRYYELSCLKRGHILTMNYFDQGKGHDCVGPGFLNAINIYYGYAVWR